MMHVRGVALVTGAGSGIGRALARKLAQHGWRIAALDVEREGLAALAAELAEVHVQCAWREADVTDAAALRDSVQEVQAELGDITLAVASAGIADDTPADPIDAAKIEQIIRVDLLGVVNTVAAVLPGMLERKHGQVAAISSLAAYHGLPCQMAYCASKAGVNALMESLRLDVAPHGIAVTVVCLGWTRTPQTEGIYDEADLMELGDTAQAIVAAIERRARVCAFPWTTKWELRLMRLLPGWLQDRLIRRRMRELKKGRECVVQR